MSLKDGFFMPFIQAFDKSTLKPVDVDLKEMEKHVQIRLQQIVKNKTYTSDSDMTDSKVLSQPTRICSEEDFAVRPSLFKQLQRNKEKSLLCFDGMDEFKLNSTMV